MGLFNQKRQTEKTYEENGFVIGVDSHIIYHVPKLQIGSTYILPNGTTNLSETAITEMRNSMPKKIVVPGSFKKFNIQLFNFTNLSQIDLQEGIEEVFCSFGQITNAVDIKLPTTIKKIGQNNYPIVQNLILPNGVIEIATNFASHDTNLITVSIPGTIKSIPNGAFNQCRNLQSIVFNEGVETSGRGVARGTNNLRTLEIPSTYNGSIDLSMESRSVSNARGNSKYDGRNFDEEKNNILKIKIKRKTKKFEFNIRRGEILSIEVRQNIVEITNSSNQQIISIDCNTLTQGNYNIENGYVRMQPQEFTQSHSARQTPTSIPTNQSSTKTTSQQNQQGELDDSFIELDLIFQNAYRENITRREDFKKLPFAVKMQIRIAMKELFLQSVSQYGSLDTSFSRFNYFYEKALRIVAFEESNSQSPDSFGSGKKR